MNPLTQAEQSQLFAAEQAIESSFAGVSDALTTILGKQLFRGTHDSFEKYCWERFAVSRSLASKLLLLIHLPWETVMAEDQDKTKLARRAGKRVVRRRMRRNKAARTVSQ